MASDIPRVNWSDVYNLRSGLRELFPVQGQVGVAELPNVPFDALAIWRVRPTQPISTGGSGGIRLTPVAPFEHPQRATHESGVTSPNRARTRYAGNVYFWSVKFQSAAMFLGLDILTKEQVDIEKIRSEVCLI